MRWRGVACVMAMVLGTAASAQSEADFVIGVRADAPPFSYLTAPARDAKTTRASARQASGKVYSGYMVNICATVLGAMPGRSEFTVEWREVTAKDRFDQLENGDIDVLCDPATITRERLAHPDILVSAPVYLSGVGLARTTRDQWPGHWPCIGPVVGVVEGTTAKRSIEQIAADFGFGQTFSKVVSAHPDVDEVTLTDAERASLVRCTEVVPTLPKDFGQLAAYTGTSAEETDPEKAFVVRAYPDHQSLARALCSGEVYYSAGDLEIVARALQVEMDVEEGACPAEVDPKVYSEERYGIFAHVAEQMDDGDRLALRFMRQLSIEINKGTNSILVQSFADNFERTEISRSLDLFFWSVVAGTH